MPTSSQLVIMKSIVDVLRPLAEATTLLCGEKLPSISLAQPVLTALLRKHLVASTADLQVAFSMKEKISNSLKEHFSDPQLEQFLLLAAVLDPRFKALKFLSSAKLDEVYAHLQAATQRQYEQEHESESESEAPIPKRPRQQQDLLDYVESSGSEGGSSPSSALSVVEKEIALYRREDQSERESNPLDWWRINAHRFKTVSVLARQVLMIPATSVPSERIFSTAGTIVNKKRAALKPKNVDCLLFLSTNL